MIREYPGSPTLNTEFDYWTDGISEQIYNKNNKPSFIPLKVVKAYPEYWEEIIEYPIIKMKNKEEIFTIGDKTNNGTISKFEVDTYGVRVFFEEKPKNYHVSLNTIKHAKTALFCTEDGVDIFEGDEYWYVGDSMRMYHIEKAIKGLDEFIQGQKDFSTKEKTEKYILMNKPCLSINDVMNAGYGICSPNPLINIVKSKE